MSAWPYFREAVAYVAAADGSLRSAERAIEQRESGPSGVDPTQASLASELIAKARTSLRVALTTLERLSAIDRNPMRRRACGTCGFVGESLRVRFLRARRAGRPGTGHTLCARCASGASCSIDHEGCPLPRTVRT